MTYVFRLQTICLFLSGLRACTCSPFLGLSLSLARSLSDFISLSLTHTHTHIHARHKQTSQIKRDAGSICRLIEVSISISQPQNAPPPPAELKTVLEGKFDELAKALATQQTPSMSENGKGGGGGGVHRTNVVAPGRLSSPQQHQINSQLQQTAASRAPTPQQRHHNHQKEQPLQQPLQQQQPPQEKLSAQQKQVQAQQAQMEARHQAQAQHLKFRAQKAAMDKVVDIKSPLIPLVNLKQLLQKVDLFPAPIRWELLIHRGGHFCASYRLVAHVFNVFRERFVRVSFVFSRTL